MTDILDGLTGAQRDAVTHIKGPLLVVAGPGSGKTRVITRRIAYLLHCGIRPWSVLGITFTNKAANEMRRRVEDLTGDRRVGISTFHSFCARSLRRYAESLGYGRDFTIFDAGDSLSLVQQVIKEHEVSREQYRPGSVLAAISSAKDRLAGPEELAREAEAAENPRLERIAAVYRDYQERLRAANAMDFDDLLAGMHRLLSSHEKALERLRRRHEFVLVDEFQDTNRTQYRIARLLAEEHRNLCATGDPDQSIYGWRGAQLGNLEEFERDFPEAKTVFLDRNYRSTKTILAAADTVVAHNTERKERRLYTENEHGEPIRLFHCPDSDEEARRVVEIISGLLEAGLHPRDIAVFYRVNWLSRHLEEEMVSWSIPYQIVGGVEFYSRREIKDILAYLRVAANPDDETSLLRIIDTPRRHVGPKALEALREWAAENDASLHDAVNSPEARERVHSRGRKGLEELAAILGKVRAAAERGARAAVVAAAEESGYLDRLRSSGEDSDEDRIDNIEELANAAAEYDGGAPRGAAVLSPGSGPSARRGGLLGGARADGADTLEAPHPDESEPAGPARAGAEEPAAGAPEAEQQPADEPPEAHEEERADEPPAGLPGFLEETALVSDVDGWRDEEDRVTLMTMHAAKGLEFAAVIITGLEETILPHERSMDTRRELEEERRVFFVAMTRAEKHLYLTASSERMKFGSWMHNRPSRFIDEIPEELLESEGAAPAAFAVPARKGEPPEGRGAAPAASRGKSGGSGAGARRGEDAAEREVASAGARRGEDAAGREAPSAAGRFKKGTRVRHSRFGMGVVKAVTPQGRWHKATVKFNRAGTRKLILEKAPLEIITA